MSHYASRAFRSPRARAGGICNRGSALRDSLRCAVRDVMTKDNLITVPVGTTLEKPRRSCINTREKLLVVDDHYNLKG